MDDDEDILLFLDLLQIRAASDLDKSKLTNPTACF